MAAEVKSMSASMEEARTDLLSDDVHRKRNGIAIVEAEMEAGDPLATYAVATWHLFGAHGYALNYAAAAPLLQYAADRGVAEAAFDLAILLEKERVGPRSKRDAFGYYTLAALLGERRGIDELARCFYWGIGTFQNKSLAEKLFELNTSDHQQLAAE